jgi:nitrogen regulatory protein PII
MKRLEIVLERDQLDRVRRVLAEHATGYTMVPTCTGLGHHGVHEDDMVLLVTVVTFDHLDPILDALLPILDRRSGVVLISEVQVLRGQHFVPEMRNRTTADSLHSL